MRYRSVLIRGSTLILVLLAIGTLFYYSVEDISFIDAFYFSGVTLTTLGYGDFIPTNPASKIFTVFYTMAGIGTLFFIMGKLFHIIFQNTLLDPVFHERHQPIYRRVKTKNKNKKNKKKQ